ncbi:uncharacterized protein LOC132795495 [Drosophila nasuta]|uniref:Uncharacterized protein LOC117567854 n=1 Tax=Drosophila albomicans TaxID=7291 RepID=A0A6P8WMY0_DROAB|nr:uncharacterized protein LOC117567854 [Drosophila albomicans]XP_060662218.1 uncharacterized protein LOC132795495 [Drosophila nasuta]
MANDGDDDNDDAQQQISVKPRDSCQHLLNGRVALHYICHSYINEEIFVKTRSNLIKKGDPMTLFIDDSQTIFFATMESSLHSCIKLLILQRNVVQCFEAATQSIIQFNRSQLYCFPYHLYIADMAMDNCDVANRKFHRAIVGKTSRAALHIAIDQKMSRGVVNTQIERLKLLLTVLLLFRV